VSFANPVERLQLNFLLPNEIRSLCKQAKQAYSVKTSALKKETMAFFLSCTGLPDFFSVQHTKMGKYVPNGH
jgi:hypothetical protein